MIAPETLLEAHYVFARTGVALARARSSSDETDWQGIRGALSAAEALREGVSRPAVSEAEVALVEAALMVQAGRFHEALETIESGVGQASGTVELELAVERAEVLAALGRREARAAYDRALTLCRRVSPSNAALLIKLLRGLAREQQRAGALKKAIAAGGEALARARRQVPDLVIGLVEMQQTLYRENGAPGLALKAVRDAGRRLQRSPTPDPAASMALVLAEASARFGLADPLGALELGRKVLGEIERSAGAAGCPAQAGAPGGNGGNGGSGGPGGRGGRINVIVPLDNPFLAGIVAGRSPGGAGGPGGPGGAGGKGGKGGQGGTDASNRRCPDAVDGAPGQAGSAGPTGSQGSPGPRSIVVTAPAREIFGVQVPPELGSLLERLQRRP